MREHLISTMLIGLAGVWLGYTLAMKVVEFIIDMGVK